MLDGGPDAKKRENNRIGGHMSADNKAVARRVREEIWNKKNFGLANEIIGQDCVHQVHDPLTPPLGRGPQGLTKLVDVYMNAFPDAQCTVDEVISEGDRVVVRWTARGTHTGQLLQIAPTGKKVHAGGVDIYRFVDGKIQDHRIIWDAMGFAQQLGIHL
jgi:steroid delta-isomerase-like uncharacterized protein